MNGLSDDELTALANGGAERELSRRRQERRENARKNEEAMRQQQAEAGLRSLDTETLKKIARDPRQENDSKRRDLWGAVPAEVWSGGYSKSDVVRSAQGIVQERIEENERHRVRQNTLPSGGVPRWVAVAGGAVLVGAALQKL